MNANVPAPDKVRRMGTSSNPGAGRSNSLRKSHALTAAPLPSRTSLAQMPSYGELASRAVTTLFAEPRP